MSDLLHDHDSLGYRRGCVACAQVEADLSISRRAMDGAPRRPSGLPMIGMTRPAQPA